MIISKESCNFGYKLSGINLWSHVGHILSEIIAGEYFLTDDAQWLWEQVPNYML